MTLTIDFDKYPLVEAVDEKCPRCGSQRNVLLLKDLGTRVCLSCLPEFLIRRIVYTIKSHHMLEGVSAVAAAVSGGKDSAVMLDALVRAGRSRGVRIKPFHLNLGFGEFSDRAQSYACQAAARNGIDITVFNISDYGIRIEPVKTFSACAVCGAVKRILFNRFARELGCDVVATAHTLDDMLLFAIKNILSGRNNLPPSMVRGNGAVPGKIKPLYFIPEYLTELYCRIEEIEHTVGECPVSDGKGHRMKHALFMLDVASPSVRRQLLKNLKKIFGQLGSEPRFPDKRCWVCGEPNTQEICAVCRVRQLQSEEQSGKIDGGSRPGSRPATGEESPGSTGQGAG